MKTTGKLTPFAAVDYARKRLCSAGIESARFEAKQLTEFLLSDGEVEKSKLDELIDRRIKNEPLQYILGQWEFYFLPFFCGEGVLIPRPDTETLCDKAIEFIGQRELRCIDLCSGSGCVAVAIAEYCRNATVWALEKYPQAFSYLEKNIAHNRSRVQAVKGDIFAPLQEKFDVIVSNPPYIPRGELPTLQKEVKREPETALDGGEDGLDFYRAIAQLWVPHLNDGGLLAVEVGIDQGEAVKELFKTAGLRNIGSVTDLGGIERVIFGTLINI